MLVKTTPVKVYRFDLLLKLIKMKPTCCIQKTILNAFLSDSFVLPAHWCYITADIEKSVVAAGLFGDRLLAPGLLNEYHKPKMAGCQTHYGDQMFWLLEHVADTKGLNDGWSETWLNHMKDASYTGYKDHVTNCTSHLLWI